MKATIDVKDRKEAACVKAAMEDPVIRAAVLVIGALASLPTDKAKLRCLRFVQETLDEERELATAAGA